jgi:L-arabinose isomerase
VDVWIPLLNLKCISNPRFMNTTYPYRIGLFGIGLDTYWPQFEGLKTRLEGYLGTVETRMTGYGAEVVSAGLVDSPEKAQDAAWLFREKNVDLIFLYITTYALSSTVLPVVRRAGVPVIILNLVPGKAIDYESFNSLSDRTAMTGEWLAYCSPCPAPEIANVFTRANIPFHQITGSLEGDPAVWTEVEDWVSAGRVAHDMAHNRLGLMGHYYGGMLDVYSDLTQHLVSFGGHIEMLEVDELTVLRREVAGHEIADRLAMFAHEFDIQSDCGTEDLREAARTSVALDRLAEQYTLGSLAYYYKGSGTENEASIATIILGSSLLTARGIPVAGEYEVKNIQAMKIMECFGAGGSFTEYYALDLKEDLVLMGHDGPGHTAIASGKTKVKPLKVFHGKVGKGLSVEMSVRPGPVTLLSVVEEAGGGLRLLVAEGETVPGPILEIGNTNSRYRFPIGAKKFVEDWNSSGPAHHCAVGVGHIGSGIEKLGKLLNMKVVRVC